MPALLFNLHSSELLIVALVAILVFGRRLPEVAAQAANGLGRLRAALERMRHETGIDHEIQEVRRNVRQGLEGVRARDLRQAAQERILAETGIDESTREALKDPLAEESGADPFAPAKDDAGEPDERKSAEDG